MGRVLLLRHGQSTWNAEGRWQGWADPPLSEVGRAQARAAAEALHGAGLEVVVSSDLLRARETADIVAGMLGLGPVSVDAGLRERDVGDWSGLTTSEIEARWPGQIDAWRRGELTAIPGGEGDISGRVVATVQQLMLLQPGRTLLAVSHGGVIRSLERVLGADPQPVRNMGGRWIEMDGSALQVGATVVLHDPEAPLPRTTVL